MKEKILIQKNFSKHAKNYDDYSEIQKKCALNLISFVRNSHFNKILDIGCGTGIYTALLRKQFKNAGIKAVDLSGEMISIAKNKIADNKIKFIAEDAEQMDINEKFDLITSNAAFHWFRDLGSAFRKFKLALKEKGIILFSAFGPKTFYELGRALNIFSGKRISLEAAKFRGKDAMRALVKERFKSVEIVEKEYKKDYASLAELLKIIKYSGTRGCGVSLKGIWTPGTIRKLEHIYKDNAPGKGIKATYQIFFCKAK